MKIFGICVFDREGMATVEGVLKDNNSFRLRSVGMGGRDGRYFIAGELREVGGQLILLVSHGTESGLPSRVQVFGQVKNGVVQGSNFIVPEVPQAGEFAGVLGAIVGQELLLIDRVVCGSESARNRAKGIPLKGAAGERRTNGSEPKLEVVAKRSGKPFPVVCDPAPGLSVTTEELVGARDSVQGEETPGGTAIF